MLKMSQLLGRKDCIESLQKDVADLQVAILDVFSTTGQVRVFSWKFPDKLSSNLDLDLEQYDFMDGEDEFNQHSHVVLLELVIDRLLLLLQASSAYVVQLSTKKKKQQHHQKDCMSVGLVVKKYWRHLVEFADMKVRCMENKLKTEMLDWDECVTSTSPQMKLRNESSINDFSAWSSTSSIKFLPADEAPSSDIHSLLYNPKVHTCNISSQTIESASAPCGACHQVQSTIRKTGNALVELLQGEGLPSSLQQLLIAVEDTVDKGQMSSGDVAQWASEQLRDMRRLAKHVQQVRNTVDPLTNKLAAAEAEQIKLRYDMESAEKELKGEVEKHKSTVLQMELLLKKAQATMKETEERLSEEYQQLRREYASLKKYNSSLEDKIAIQQDGLQALECERNALQEKLKMLQVGEKVCSELHQRIQQLESQISVTELLLEKEKAKYHSACHHQESMETKQTSLLQRLYALDEECEDLQRRLGQREESELNLHNQLQQMSEVNEQLQVQITSHQDICSQLQSEKQALETHLDEFKSTVTTLKESVKSLKDRERLLVAFPELSPLAHTQPQSTGNVLLDMEQQRQANYIRIRVLEKENATLHSSLVKLREATQPNAVKDSSPPQTCSHSLASTLVEKQLEHLTQMQWSPFSRKTRSASWMGDKGGSARDAHGASNREKNENGNE
ncbi:coiled-coil domain-containing protein 157 isoform X3 [Dunckerocampus dactyliophorus]|uniref:coiled-coil domain-containing protein 157 isoform X3 n=1 Tax=Dunckerocampus dactyliophorus TaxID=161453 RepID=UPI0024053A33|nr:coiled-coil domain-containing protein 157 isoform X3 [Dunckerocampus dactyliophorus]